MLESDAALGAAVRTCLFYGDEASGYKSVSDRLLRQLVPGSYEGRPSPESFAAIPFHHRREDVSAESAAPSRVRGWLLPDAQMDTSVGDRHEVEITHYGTGEPAPLVITLLDRQTSSIRELRLSKPLPVFKVTFILVPGDQPWSKRKVLFTDIAVDSTRSGREPIAITTAEGGKTAYAIDPLEYGKCLEKQLSRSQVPWRDDPEFRRGL